MEIMMIKKEQCQRRCLYIPTHSCANVWRREQQRHNFDSLNAVAQQYDSSVLNRFTAMQNTDGAVLLRRAAAISRPLTDDTIYI